MVPGRSRAARLAMPASLAAVAVLLAGCSVFTPRFGTAFAAEGDIPELPVSLTDESRLVTGLATTPADPSPRRDQFMRTAPAGADQLMVQWVGTGCDATVSINVTNIAAVPSPGAATFPPDVIVSVATDRREGACEAVPIRRALVIRFDQLIDMRRAAVVFAP